MSLSSLTPPTRLKNPHNVLTLDIERLPGRARIQHRGLTIEGDFWDLSGWKHTIGYRIKPEDVIEWPRTICAAWNWYGKDRVHFASEWGKGGRETMLRRIWAAYDKAQLVVGHNVDAFDTKKLKSEWLDLGMTPPSPFKSVDTLKVARREFGYESNTLDALCQRLGISAKTDRYEVAVARAACAGDKTAQARLKGYNCGDIAASVGLYDVLRPWHPTHPHSVVATLGDEPSCNSCWNADNNLHPNGFKLANQILYRLYRCDCGANVQGTRHSRAAITRGAR
jgi:hypothetical protein